MDDQAKGKI